MYQTILFDLDGTLTDSSRGIINSVCYALEKMQIPCPLKEELLVFIGPPLQESFSRYFHLTPEQCQQAIAYYREYFSQKGRYENEVYPQVYETLAELKSSGKQLLLATSKPEIFAIQILEYFRLDRFFDLIAGASLDNSRITKTQVIEYALGRARIFDTSTCLMVGDRLHDIHGAQENQMQAIGVLYGFGSREELETAGASYIINTLPELLKIAN